MSQTMASVTPPQQASGYITQLNALRGIAALVVVVYHVHLKLLQQGSGSFLMLFDRGYLAVDLFFILSGFVLMYVYSKNATFSKLSLHSYLTFISKRAARIFPVHWLVMLMLLGIELVKYLPFIYKKLDAASLPFSTEKSIYSFFTNLFLIQNWGLNSTFTWNVPAWSISAEWFTYLLAPLLMIGLNFFQGTKGRRDEGTNILSIVGWVLFYTVLSTAVMYISSSRHGSLDIGYNYGNLRMFLEFLMGGCLCLVFHQLQHIKFKGFDWLALGSALSLIVLQQCRVLDLVFPGVLSLMILFVALSQGKVRQILSHKSLFYLGEISFSLYLVHQLIVTTFPKLFHLGSFQTDASYLVACLVLSTVAAHFMYKFVEIPVRDFLNGKFAAWLAPLKRSTPIQSTLVAQS